MALLVLILRQCSRGNLVHVSVSAQPSLTTMAASLSLDFSSSDATSRALASAASRDSIAWIAFSMAATLGRLVFGTLARTFLQKWTVQRWQAASGKTSAIDPTMPAALPPVNMRTPRRPRDLSRERSSRRHSEDSVKPSAAPMASRQPSSSTPIAAIAATFS